MDRPSYKDRVKRLTRLRSLGVLLCGAAMAIAAPTIDAQLRQEREHIIRAGVQVPADVLAVKEFWQIPITRAVLRYTLHGRQETTEVTHPWGTDLEEGQRVRVFIDPGDPGRVALEEGHSNLGGQWLPMPLAVFGGVGLLAPLLGAVSLRWQRRWDRRTLDDITIGPPRIRHDRGVVRRHDPVARILFGTFAVGMLVILAMLLWRIPGEYWLGTAVIAPFLVGLYLPAFTARVEITRSAFLIYGPMRITVVPRQLVTGCALQPDGTLALILAGHPPVIIPVGISPYLLPADSPKPYHRPQQLLTMARIRGIVEALPAETGAGTPDAPVTRTRHVAVACLALACLACTLTVLSLAGQ